MLKTKPPIFLNNTNMKKNPNCFPDKTPSNNVGVGKMLLKIFIFSSLSLFLQNCNKNITEQRTINKIGSWEIVEIGVSNNLYDLDFINDETGWIIGEDGIILHSTNGGQSWYQENLPIQDILFAIDFIDNKNGWICGRNSIINTNNSGNSWNIQYTTDLGEGRFRDIGFIDKNIGFAVGGRGFWGEQGILLKTDNGGQNWDLIELPDLPTLTSLSITNERIWICGFSGTLLFSLDNGNTWERNDLSSSPSPAFRSVHFLNSYGWVSSRDDYLGFYFTVDSGNNWLRISEDSFKIIGGVQSFYFIDKNNGWMCNFPFDRILKTTDSGFTWEYDSEIRQRINSFVFTVNGNGWAVGNDGGLLKYTINIDD